MPCRYPARQARAIGEAADGVVVGSAIVATIAQCYDANGKRIEDPAEAVATLVKGLADGVRSKQMA